MFNKWHYPWRSYMQTIDSLIALLRGFKATFVPKFAQSQFFWQRTGWGVKTACAQSDPNSLCWSERHPHFCSHVVQLWFGASSSDLCMQSFKVKGQTDVDFYWNFEFEPKFRISPHCKKGGERRENLGSNESRCWLSVFCMADQHALCHGWLCNETEPIVGSICCLRNRAFVGVKTQWVLERMT